MDLTGADLTRLSRSAAAAPTGPGKWRRFLARPLAPWLQ